MAKYRYWNENTSGEKRNDCVTRAITLASGLPYAKVRKKLFHTAKLLECSKLCWSCYSFLLSDVLGYRQVNCDGLTVGEFADLHPQGIYLIRIEGHLTTVCNGEIRDTWNCQDKKCFIAWRVA